MKSNPAVVVIRDGARGRGLVLLVLLAVALYYAATHLRDILAGVKRPTLEGIARAIGVPDDVIQGASDNTLRELIVGRVKSAVSKGAWWAALAAVLFAFWRMRPLFGLIAAGGAAGLAATAAIVAATAAGYWIVTTVGEAVGVGPGGGSVPAGGCRYDGSTWVCDPAAGEPVGWNTGGSVYV